MSKVLGVSCAWLMGEEGAPGGADLTGLDASSQKLLVAWERLDARDQAVVLNLAHTLAASRPVA